MPEWLMGTDCKSVSIAYAGSNPARPNKKNLRKIYFCTELILYAKLLYNVLKESTIYFFIET